MIVVWQHETVQGEPIRGAPVNPYSTTHDTTVRFDPSYIKTLPGYLKIAQLILNLVGYICIEVSGIWAYHSRAAWFNFVSMTGFSVTQILLVLYLFHIPDKLNSVPWNKFEFGFCIIWVLLYFMASLLVVLCQIEAFIAAGFFGFCAMTAYGIDAVIKYQAMQIRHPAKAQGDREMDIQPTPTVTSPLTHP